MKRTVKSLKDLIGWLATHGYKMDDDAFESDTSLNLCYEMLEHCGKDIEVDGNLCSTGWAWKDEWLEPVVLPPKVGDFCKFWDDYEEPADDSGGVCYGFLQSIDNTDNYPYGCRQSSSYVYCKLYSTGGAK